MLDIGAHTHSDTITLGSVSDTQTLTYPRSTNLRNTVDVEVGEGGVGESRRRRGQSREEHRLSLHLDWCDISMCWLSKTKLS